MFFIFDQEFNVDPDVHTRYSARARVIKAMAHPTRLFIVDELSRGEKCVHELTDMIGADMSTVSRHLSVLKGAGILLDEKRGSQVYYKLRMTCVLNFFDCVESVLKSSADDFRELVESEQGKTRE
jgi:ArsR family transcriptional regulator